ncbi:MAG: hypothetical protein OXG96_16925 [Acidobacteria bacterium]|nr:hypothetical protein [Acidobacteriota bacterium]
MGINRTMAVPVILLMGLSLVLLAGDKPDFSGTWTLDPERSEMGRGGRGPGAGRFGAGRGAGRPREGDRQRGGGPGRRGRSPMGRGGMRGSLTIDHKEGMLVIRQTLNFRGEEQVRTSRFTTDGKESTNPGFGGMSMPSKTTWDGNRLVTESSMETRMGLIQSREVRSLSDDGKTMTVVRTTRGGPRERTQKLVYVKEAAP